MNTLQFQTLAAPLWLLWNCAQTPRYGAGAASDVRSLIHEMSDLQEAKYGALQAPLRPSTMESPRPSAYAGERVRVFVA